MGRMPAAWWAVLFQAALVGLDAGAAQAAERIVTLTGTEDARLAPFDELLRQAVARHGAPGAALAVTKQGKLVYCRGAGLADPDHGEPVQPDSRFRIASISKPITAVAVLQLVERGTLRLEDPIFSVLGIDVDSTKDSRIDPRLGRVTVLQCLQHTGGWDREKAFDPMFRSVEFAERLGLMPPAGPDAVIRAMLAEPLQFDPGERYAYSNFGYCLLGRVIEKTSGMPYEDYVLRHVLKPIGAKRTRLGRTLRAGRLEGEVVYRARPMKVSEDADATEDGGDAGALEPDRTGPSVFAPNVGAPVPLPYGAWHLEAMDAHGGWVSTAEDLVRFASAFDDPERCPLLKPESVRRMFARPEGLAGHSGDGAPLDVYYGCGWSVRVVKRADGAPGENHWHAGALDGTSTLLVRRHDGLCWAILFNTQRTPKNERLSTVFDSLIHRAADAVTEWPE